MRYVPSVTARTMPRSLNWTLVLRVGARNCVPARSPSYFGRGSTVTTSSTLLRGRGGIQASAAIERTRLWGPPASVVQCNVHFAPEPRPYIPKQGYHGADGP